MLISLTFVAVGVILVFVVDTVLESAYESAKEASASSGYTITGEASDLKDFPLLYEIGVALLVFGVILFVLSIMGCCGSCCSSCCRYMILVFAVVLAVVMVAQIIVFSLFLVKDSSLHKKLKAEIQTKITDEYDESSGNAFTAAIIIMNREGNCCGMEGVADFGTKDHQSCETENENKGCYDEIQEMLQDNKLYAGLSVAGLLLLQLIEIICSIIIFMDAKSKISPI